MTVLTAGKSSVGHTEPAAGLVGVTHAALAIGAAVLQPILHLTALNPYISGSQADSFAMPRQAAGRNSSPAALTGVSSFAFQGTNGHIVVGNTDVLSVVQPEALDSAVWKRQYTGVLPPMHCLLHTVSMAAGIKNFVFEAHLGHATCAFFFDHQVSGKAIFPGMAHCGAAKCTFSICLRDEYHYACRCWVP
jgi:hypothetical protein